MSEENKRKGKPMFYNIWGTRNSKLAFIFIVIIILAMVSLKMCDSRYVVPGDPNEIKIIE